MYQPGRRKFLQSSAVLLAVACFDLSFTEKNKKPLLSFSTLGCPDWTFSQILDFAVQHGYSGIEVRGIQRQLDLIQCKEFSSAQNRKDSLKQLKDRNLKFVDLGSSCTLHFSDGAERTKNLDEGKRFIDIASETDCPFIRVFPNNFIKEREKAATIDLIVKGLLELGEYANGTNVTVLIESHGDLVKIDDLETVMKAAAHKHTGMIWDIANMWTITKEDPALAYARLKPYIKHTHIKDAALIDGKPQYKLLQEGEVPVMQAVELLYNGGYKGFYSFEWEKLWHPEIAAPEIALSDFPEKMKAHFKL
jgi:sugar phosphate isomerase/epimerase